MVSRGGQGAWQGCADRQSDAPEGRLSLTVHSDQGGWWVWPDTELGTEKMVRNITNAIRRRPGKGLKLPLGTGPLSRAPRQRPGRSSAVTVWIQSSADFRWRLVSRPPFSGG